MQVYSLRRFSRLLPSGALILFFWQSLCTTSSAAVVVNMTESGGDVVAVGIGTLDVTDLSTSQTVSGNGIFPVAGVFQGGAGGTGDLYGTISGPASFGTGGAYGKSNGTGDGPVGICMSLFCGSSDMSVIVPTGHAVTNTLSFTETYSGESFASLGLTPGTYVWTWGAANPDSFTINILVPEPSTWALLWLGFVPASLRWRR